MAWKWQKWEMLNKAFRANFPEFCQWSPEAATQRGCVKQSESRRTWHRGLFTGAKSLLMLLPPSASPALELSPLIRPVQPPEKSPEVPQFWQHWKTLSITLKSCLYQWNAAIAARPQWNTSLFQYAGRGCFPTRFSAMRKEKRYSHNLWTLSSEQSGLSLSFRGCLFQWPLYSDSTTIKASPSKALAPLRSAYRTSPRTRRPLRRAVGRPATMKLFDRSLKNMSNRPPPPKHDTIFNHQNRTVKGMQTISTAKEEDEIPKHDRCFHKPPSLTRKHPVLVQGGVVKQLWRSLQLTWRCDDVWLRADAALVIYVDESGPQGHHSFPLAHSAGVQIWKAFKRRAWSSQLLIVHLTLTRLVLSECTPASGMLGNPSYCYLVPQMTEIELQHQNQAIKLISLLKN